MTNLSGRDEFGVSPLAGLMPSRLRAEALDAAPVRPFGPQERSAPRERSRLARSLFETVPVILVGTLAITTLNLTGTIDTVSKSTRDSDSNTSDLGPSIRSALAASETRQANASTAPADDAELAPASVPATYAVRGGDTVSEIAGRFHLSTASVLAMNGLSWKAIIFPGQVLKLTKTKHSSGSKSSGRSSSSKATRYTIRAGDTISRIASHFGVSMSALLRANGLAASSIIYAGRTLVIPGRSTAGAPAHSAQPPAAPPAVHSNPGSYTIRTGDTVTSIAKRFGISVGSLMAANGLSASSIIYAGRVLVIPRLAPADVGGVSVPLSPEMRRNAMVIVSIGKQLKVPHYGIIIALAAAAQESGLRNLTSGDRDSIGLFQQRPAMGWGSPKQLLDTAYASRLFFGGHSNPNKGNTRGLLDIHGWQKMSVARAAQAVQISAHPSAYAKWESSARAWLSQLD
jgi:LysM repeat protein